ncbi:MAG: NAD(P)H-dependent glycerol-3-phosphate dehydrogenase [Eubacteriales bacterium]
MKITVAGAGTWGTALGRILALKGQDVCIWSRFREETDRLSETRTHPNLPGAVIPESIRFTTDISEAASGADYLIMVVPSVYTRETAKDFAPYLDEKTILISAAKGIESSTLMTLTEVIGDELKKAGKDNTAVALSGPTHAEEVARDLPTLIVCACEDLDAARKVQQLFDGTCIRPYVNPDAKGVQICGALKNVEALAVGIARGLGYGDNTCAAMITRGMEEIRRLGLEMGCREKTFFGLAGIGDLIVTATSRHSRNNRAGFLIGQGKTVDEAVREIGMVVEGMNALPAAVALCEKFGMDMPLISAVRAVVYDHAQPSDVVRELMNRSLKME